MEDDTTFEDILELKISDDTEILNGSSDSMVLIPPSSISNTYNTMENYNEKNKNETLSKNRPRCDAESIEKKVYMEKSSLLEDKLTQLEKDLESGSSFRLKIVSFINALEKIIYEDETRYELFAHSPEPSIYNYEQHSLNMSTENIENTLDKLRDYVVRKMNKYYDELMDMDNRILNLNTEKANLKETITEKDLIIKTANKNKQESTLDSGDQFQSLKAVDKVNKRNMTEISQLKDEVKSLESENYEMHTALRTLKRDLKSRKIEFDELEETYNDLILEKGKLERENKKLKKKKSIDSEELEEQLSKLKDKNRKYKGKLESKDEKIESLEEEIKALNKKSKSAESIKGSLRKEEIENEIEELKEKLRNMAEEMEQKEEEAKTQEMELKTKIQNKDEGLATIRQKYDVEKNQKEIFMEKCGGLEEKLTQLEKELEMKGGAILKMKEKLKNLPSMENELKNAKQLQLKVTAKETENNDLTKALEEMRQKLEDQVRKFELTRKEKLGLETEIQNMKLLNFKNKDTQN